MNQEIIRARKIIAELKSNNDKAHQLADTLKNLLTVQRLLLEQRHRLAPRGLPAIPKITTWRLTKEVHNLTIERDEMKNESEVKLLACYFGARRQTIKAVRKIPPRDAERLEGK